MSRACRVAIDAVARSHDIAVQRKYHSLRPYGPGDNNMPVNIPRLVYFEEFMNPVAVSILSGREDLDLVRLEYASPEDENLAEMRRAHGYQIQPRTELREPWFGDAALLMRCPNILAISSTG